MRKTFMRIKILSRILWVLVMLSLLGCAALASIHIGQRSITLGGKTFTESSQGEFITWKCRDYPSGSRILVEVGYFANTDSSSLGFVLFDGGTTGTLTHYGRQGINRRWDWGPGENDQSPLGGQFAFVLKPDDTGLYYDFSVVKTGETTKAADIYTCSQ